MGHRVGHGSVSEVQPDGVGKALRLFSYAIEYPADVEVMFAELNEPDPEALSSRRFLSLLYGSLRKRCTTSEALDELERKLTEDAKTTPKDMRAALTRAGMSEVQADGAMAASKASTPEDRIRARIRVAEAAKKRALAEANKDE